MVEGIKGGYIGTTPKRGRILTIFGREMCYHIQLQNTKLQQIRLKNALKNPKIPKIGVPLYEGYPKKWTYIYYFLWRDLIPNKNSKY